MFSNHKEPRIKLALEEGNTIIVRLCKGSHRIMLQILKEVMQASLCENCPAVFLLVVHM